MAAVAGMVASGMVAAVAGMAPAGVALAAAIMIMLHHATHNAMAWINAGDIATIKQEP